MASAAVAWWPLVLAWWATRACLGSAAAAQAAAAQAAAAPAAQPQAATADIFSRIRGGNSEVAAQPLTLRPLHVHAWDLDRDIARAPARTSAAAATAEELLEARGVEAGPDEAAGVVAAILLELGHADEAVAAARAGYAAEADPVLPGNLDSFGNTLDNFDQAQRVVADRRAGAKAAAASHGEQRYCGHALNAWLGSCVY